MEVSNGGRFSSRWRIFETELITRKRNQTSAKSASIPTGAQSPGSDWQAPRDCLKRQLFVGEFLSAREMHAKRSRRGEHEVDWCRLLFHWLVPLSPQHATAKCSSPWR